YIDETVCQDGFHWNKIKLLAFLPLGLICGVSVGYCFWKFNFKKVASGNARNFALYFDNFKTNIYQESIPILSFSFLLTVFACFSVSSSNYFSTSKMLFNFLGKNPSEYSLLQGISWTGVGAGIMMAIFI